MSTTRYTTEHEWLRIEDGGLVTVGITDFAQSHLGDVVYVQLPEVGAELEKGAEAAVIESVKTAGEINMPTAGAIVEYPLPVRTSPVGITSGPDGSLWFLQPNAIGSITTFCLIAIHTIPGIQEDICNQCADAAGFAARGRRFARIARRRRPMGARRRDPCGVMFRNAPRAPG